MRDSLGDWGVVDTERGLSRVCWQRAAPCGWGRARTTCARWYNLNSLSQSLCSSQNYMESHKHAHTHMAQLQAAQWMVL